MDQLPTQHDRTRTRTRPRLRGFATELSAGLGSVSTFSAWVIARVAGLALGVVRVVRRPRTPRAPTPRVESPPPTQPKRPGASTPSVEASVGLFDRSETPCPIPPVFALRILLAGPDKAATSGLLAVLRGALADVVVAHGSEGVVETAMRAATGRDGPLDAVLIAMHMTSSLDTVARLRADGFTGPILALCGRAGAPSAARCQQAGCSGVAPEHITGAALMQALESLLRRHLAR